MEELVAVTITEVNQLYGGLIRSKVRRFVNYKNAMYYILSFIAIHNANVDYILSDGIGLTYYDHDDIVDVSISIMDEGSE